MTPKSIIDISENTLRHRGKVLDILLTDRTSTTKASKPINIIWATDSYTYAPTSKIKKEQITGANGKIIQPRAVKSREEQKRRTKDKAEVFTPLKIVKEMNMAINKASKNWPITTKNWIGYVSELRLEITCGEAPFITSRYDPTRVDPKPVPLHKRVGFLDYKLRELGKHAETEKDWLKYAEIALKSSYGYEWQGDNLLIARENILQTVEDFYKDFRKNKLKLKTEKGLTDIQLENFATIISWNIWQMDGLKMTLPYTGHDKKETEDNIVIGNTLFDINTDQFLKERKKSCPDCKKYGKSTHASKFAKIIDWQTDTKINFIELFE